MSVQNLDQIRANAARKAASSTSRQAVSKLPAMILQNGLLATIAFATDGSEARAKMEDALDSLAWHLADPRLGIACLSGATTAAGLSDRLCDAGATPLDLQRATAESLAFFAFLKRYAIKTESKPGSKNSPNED